MQMWLTSTRWHMTWYVPRLPQTPSLIKSRLLCSLRVSPLPINYRQNQQFQDRTPRACEIHIAPSGRIKQLHLSEFVLYGPVPPTCLQIYGTFLVVRELSQPPRRTRSVAFPCYYNLSLPTLATGLPFLGAVISLKFIVHAI